MDLKINEKLKDGPPSSPEDGEITEDESKPENNEEEVRLKFNVNILLIFCSNINSLSSKLDFNIMAKIINNCYLFM